MSALAVAGGFVQLSHGKAGPLERMREGDAFAYYSPRASYPKGAPVQAFTAIGRVRGRRDLQVRMGGGIPPFRRPAGSSPASEAPIKPLLDALSFVRNKTHWGAAFRFGFLRVPEEDFAAHRRGDGTRGRRRISARLLSRAIRASAGINGNGGAPRCAACWRLRCPPPRAGKIALIAGLCRRRFLRTMISAASPHRRAILFMIVAAVCWSSGGFLVRQLSITNAWEIVFWRSLFMALFVAGVLLVMHGRRMPRAVAPSAGRA